MSRTWGIPNYVTAAIPRFLSWPHARADRPLQLRGRPVRDRRAADRRRLLPLHPVPAPDRRRGVAAGRYPAWDAAHRRRRGPDPLVAARGRVRQAVLLRLRLAPVQPGSGASGEALGTPRRRRRRPGRAAAAPPPRRDGGGVGAATRRRIAAPRRLTDSRRRA